ncbi:MAG: urea ABC transporter ATP-binding protein UrtD [Chloroflexi bacterium]|nr:urea ABC transporter ATP-binding protein UrtD [Chloroflexota bacterium]MDA1218834.1 urea ABC transporter ATP-binding protein UrtD [Chloroflexota bacterium]
MTENILSTGNILSIEALTVSFSGFTVLDNLDFSLERGELRFIIGPNGAGKTTLLDLITGKTKPDRGKILFNGDIDLTKRQEHDLVRLGIGRKFQTPSVFTSLTVYENLEVSIGFRSSLGGLFRSLGKKDAEWIHDTLEQVGLAERSGVLAGALSHGEKQWLEIGMLLAQEPTLLLLDEPVAGMTHRERVLTGELLQKIGQDRTVVVVEHDMGFVRQFAQKVTVLHLGKVLSEGTMETVSSDQQVIRAYLGRSRTLQREDADAVASGPVLSSRHDQDGDSLN